MRAPVTKSEAFAIGLQWANDRWKNSDDAGRRGPPIFDRQWLPRGTSDSVAAAVCKAAEGEWRRLQDTRS